MRLKPLGDRLLVRPEKPAEATKTGIILAASAQSGPIRGEVVAIGPGRFDGETVIPMEVTVGQTILFAEYSGTEVEVDGDDLKLMREADVLAVIE